MRIVTAEAKRTVKFQCIAASVRELGLIEPLIIFPQAGAPGCFLLLDGHSRLEILKDLRHPDAKCLVAIDDEAFTYNHKVSRLSAIQEHFMILKAIKGGVSESLIAETLNVNVTSIREKRDLLHGICPEVIGLLQERRATSGTMRELRKVKPMRQIEMAELMIATANYSSAYAKCMVAATLQEQLVESEQPKECRGMTVDDIARMEREMTTLGREFKLIEESHGKTVFALTIVTGYLRKLLDSARVVRYLSQHHPEILTEFQKILESRNLAEVAAAS
jgi:hypothetical protein